MASIRGREGQDGRMRYTATIRLKRKGALIHQESKTFLREVLASDWARAREVELQRPGAVDKAKLGEVTVGALVKWYRETFEKVSRWQRTKGAALKQLEKQAIASQSALHLTTEQLLDHVIRRRKDGAGPATVAGDLAWLGVVLRAAKSVRSLPVHPEVVVAAKDACRELRLTGRARKRDRRPTDDELARLDGWFSSRSKRMKTPMSDIMWFAVHSAKREAEICRIEWADLDEAASTCVVRDAKHPRSKLGNHKTFKMTAEALAIVKRQPRGATRIFPYEANTVSAAFTDACKMLGIVGLRFHDMRHEATSRLFEAGYQIHEVAMFTGHESWQELKRYANLKPATMKLRRPGPEPVPGQ